MTIYFQLTKNAAIVNFSWAAHTDILKFTSVVHWCLYNIGVVFFAFYALISILRRENPILPKPEITARISLMPATLRKSTFPSASDSSTTTLLTVDLPIPN